MRNKFSSSSDKAAAAAFILEMTTFAGWQQLAALDGQALRERRHAGAARAGQLVALLACFHSFPPPAADGHAEGDH